MSYDQNYPFPQVFLVDGSREPQHPHQPPGLIPCWTFPPAQQRERHRGKSRGCGGISPGLTVAVLMLFLLVFAALGFEAYQVFNLQKELREVKKKLEPVTEVNAPEKQVDLRELNLNGKSTESRPAAHLIGRIEKVKFSQTLRWESRSDRAFTSGEVKYLAENGGLQVNETGLYHIYSRVELILNNCSPTSSFDHSVHVSRIGNSPPLDLMKAHRYGFCSHQRPHQSWTTESYLGSVHQLKKYDQVFVKISHPHELSHSPNGNFFGLYKI